MVAHCCNPSTLGGKIGRIAKTQGAEVAVSRDHTTAFQLDDKSVTPSPKIKNKIHAESQLGTRAQTCNLIILGDQGWWIA